MLLLLLPSAVEIGRGGNKHTFNLCLSAVSNTDRREVEKSRVGTTEREEPRTSWTLAVYEQYWTLKYCRCYYCTRSTSSTFNQIYVLLHSPRKTRWLCLIPYGCFALSEETVVNWGTDNTGSTRVFDTDHIANTFFSVRSSRHINSTMCQCCSANN